MRDFAHPPWTSEAPRGSGADPQTRYMLAPEPAPCAGLAIGTAWSGLLANFAAGVFLMVLRPFKADDFVTVGGVSGE